MVKLVNGRSRSQHSRRVIETSGMRRHRRYLRRGLRGVRSPPSGGGGGGGGERNKKVPVDGLTIFIFNFVRSGCAPAFTTFA